MEQRINALREQVEQRIGQIHSKEALATFWQDFLGKKGSIADLMKGLGAVAKEDRPAMGKVINEFKVQVEERYKALSKKMELLELQARNQREAVDITLPAKKTAPRTSASPDVGKERNDQRFCRYGIRCV